MKILILSTNHPYKTSGVVALDLYNSLKGFTENEVKMIVKVWDRFPDKNILPIENICEYTTKRIIEKILRTLEKFGVFKKKTIHTNPDYHLQDYDQTITYYTTDKILRKADFKPNVIIVMFMQKFISYKNLYELGKQTGAKIFLYPMDMAPFTGGCHYAWDCDRYAQQCGKCPALYSSDPEDQSFKNFVYKRELMEKTNISLFAGNTQIAEQIRKSSIFKGKEIINRIFTVPDERVFYPRNKETARDYFKIQKDKKVFFFGASSLNHKRKGMAVMIEALRIVSEKLNKYDTSKLLLLVAGMNYEQIKDDLPFDSRYIGFIQDYNELALAYCAADFYISPSLEDAGPMMVLQSILCGTPVISFDIGFARDFIEDGINGFKSEMKNVKALAQCFFEAISISKEDHSKLVSNVIMTSDEIKKRNSKTS